MVLEEIISAIKKRRASLAITQELVSDLSGISLRTIKEIERGKGNPTFTTLIKIAEVLGMEIKIEVKKLQIFPSSYFSLGLDYFKVSDRLAALPSSFFLYYHLCIPRKSEFPCN